MTKIHSLRRITYLIETLLLALLIVPSVHAQNSSDQILYAVRDDNNYTIYRASVDDGVKTRIGVIHKFGSDAGWSPDGKFIYLLDNNDPNLPSLTFIDADTNHSQPVPDQIESAVCGLPFYWSPKGDWLNYTTKSESLYRHRIFNPTTGESQALPGANIDFASLVWSANEHYLAYRSDYQPDGYSWIIRDIQNQETITDLKLYQSGFPQWSPTENRISFRSDPDHITIYNVIDDTKQEYQSKSIGDWSPDGKFLTLYHTDKDQNSLLSILDVHSKKIIELDRNLTTINYEAQSPWSSDGRYLALSKQNTPDSERTVSILDVLKNNIQTTQINLGDSDTFAWSPIGNRLAIITDIKDFEGMLFFTSLWLIDADNEQSQRYDIKISLMDSERPINWSPNGRYLTIPNESGVQLLDWDSGTLNPIDTAVQTFSRPYWSPDGTKIAAESRFDIYTLMLEGSKIKNVTNTPDQDETFLGWRGVKDGTGRLSYCGEG